MTPTKNNERARRQRDSQRHRLIHLEDQDVVSSSSSEPDEELPTKSEIKFIEDSEMRLSEHLDASPVQDKRT